MRPELSTANHKVGWIHAQSAVGAIMRAMPNPLARSRIFLYHLYLAEGGQSLARSSQMDLPKGMSSSGY